MKYPKSIEELIDCFKMLPGIGEKNAERLCFAVLHFDEDQAKKFSDSIMNVKTKIKKCNICNNYTEDSDPLVIEKVFHMSKSAFKRAIGHLYKEEKIILLKNKILEMDYCMIWMKIFFLMLMNLLKTIKIWIWSLSPQIKVFSKL